MAERSLIFPAAEYRRRTRSFQVEMENAELDALLLTMPSDIFYATGFLTRFWESPTRPWFIIVPATGDPIAVIPTIGSDLMGRTWISDIRTFVAPDPANNGMNLLADTLRALVPESGRIGLPMGNETHLRMPLADYFSLMERLVPRSLVDAAAVVRRVREIKSELEIEKIRATCRIADAAFARIGEFVRKGYFLDVVFRRLQIALLEEGADWVSYVAGGAGNGGYVDVISPASQQSLQPGDILMLDTGAVKDGYFCDFDRNFSIGRATDISRKVYASLHAATDAGLDALRPGMTAGDLHRVMAGSLRAQGESPVGGRFGHGLGISLTEWPSIMPEDETELRCGMVLTLEPGVEVEPGRIMVHEENLVLRQQGPELLNRRAPAELPEIL